MEGRLQQILRVFEKTRRSLYNDTELHVRFETAAHLRPGDVGPSIACLRRRRISRGNQITKLEVGAKLGRSPADECRT